MMIMTTSGKVDAELEKDAYENCDDCQKTEHFRKQANLEN